MFQQLNTLLASNDKVVLTVEKIGDELTVVAQTVTQNKDNETSCTLNQALTLPFVVSGTAPELDEHYSSALISHVDAQNSMADNKVQTVTPSTASSSANSTTVTNNFVDIESL